MCTSWKEGENGGEKIEKTGVNGEWKKKLSLLAATSDSIKKLEPPLADIGTWVWREPIQTTGNPDLSHSVWAARAQIQGLLENHAGDIEKSWNR